MEIKLLMLALNKLSDEHEKLKAEFSDLKAEIVLLKRQPVQSQTSVVPDKANDELLDIKEVRNILGICYNSLSKLVREGLLKPIRINQRRIRFSKAGVMRYIQSQG